MRESETWKDYRLEQFEDIIKEGRKFGVFITIASQRPADIWRTIASQLHNFFIHRLLNDRNLYYVDNTISTLDALSRGLKFPDFSRLLRRHGQRLRSSDGDPGGPPLPSNEQPTSVVGGEVALLFGGTIRRRDGGFDQPPRAGRGLQC